MNIDITKHRFLMVPAYLTVLFSLCACSKPTSHTPANQLAARIDYETFSEPVSTDIFTPAYDNSAIFEDTLSENISNFESSTVPDTEYSSDSSSLEEPSSEENKDSELSSEKNSIQSETSVSITEIVEVTETQASNEYDKMLSQNSSEEKTEPESISDTFSEETSIQNNTKPSEETLPESSKTKFTYIHKINEIYANYGIKILSGNDVELNFPFASNGINDEELLEERISIIADSLACYPYEFFSDIGGTTCLTINLVDFLDGADGYTDATHPEKITISLNCSNPASYFRLALHHELFHCFEYYALANFSDVATRMDEISAINDNRFWGTEDHSGTIYDYNAGTNEQYFTSIYAKTSPMEDRAETFAYYMSMPIKDYLRDSSSPVNHKMRLISEVMRLYCPSLGKYQHGELFWENNLSLAE